jgi:hypothetical protein
MNPTHLSGPVSVRFISILSSHLGSYLHSSHFLLRFLHNPIRMSLIPHACHMPCPSHPPLFVHPDSIWQRVQFIKLLIMQFSAASYFASFCVEIFSLAPCSLHLTSKVCGRCPTSGPMLHTRRKKSSLQFCIL